MMPRRYLQRGVCVCPHPESSRHDPACCIYCRRDIPPERWAEASPLYRAPKDGTHD